VVWTKSQQKKIEWIFQKQLLLRQYGKITAFNMRSFLEEKKDIERIIRGHVAKTYLK
jgi:hypothetical protein